jgi:hypothetical protein
MSSRLKEVAWPETGDWCAPPASRRSGGEVQMLELAAPQSLAPDEVVIAVRAAGVGNWTRSSE